MVDQALADMGRAIASDPRDRLALLERADLYLRRNDTDAALADYERALKLDPRDARALHGRGRLPAGEGEYDAGAGRPRPGHPARADATRAAGRARRGAHSARGLSPRGRGLRAGRPEPSGREVLSELERRAEAHLGDDPARAADVCRDTLKAIVGGVEPPALRRRVERELVAADKAADRREALRLRWRGCWRRVGAVSVCLGSTASPGVLGSRGGVGAASRTRVPLRRTRADAPPCRVRCESPARPPKGLSRFRRGEARPPESGGYGPRVFSRRRSAHPHGQAHAAQQGRGVRSIARGPSPQAVLCMISCRSYHDSFAHFHSIDIVGCSDPGLQDGHPLSDIHPPHDPPCVIRA